MFRLWGFGRGVSCLGFKLEGSGEFRTWTGRIYCGGGHRIHGTLGCWVMERLGFRDYLRGSGGRFRIKVSGFSGLKS